MSRFFFCCPNYLSNRRQIWYVSVFEAYKELYRNKKSDIKIRVNTGIQELFPEYQKPEPVPETPKVFEPISNTDEKPAYITLLQQVLQEEDKVRSYRESLRMRYYTLEDQKAHISAFQKNHAEITEQTKRLQSLYIQRRHIEIHGKAPEQRAIMTEEENNALRRLKYDRKCLVDKLGKLKRKASNYLSQANGPANLPRWENEIDESELKIYELDQEINKINGV